MKDPRLYLSHVQICIGRIKQYTKNGKDDFFSDIKTQDAVIRNLETLGDAVQKLPDEWKSAHPEIEWRRIADFRNVLAHQYLDINLVLVWNIIDGRLPELEEAIEAITGECRVNE